MMEPLLDNLFGPTSTKKPIIDIFLEPPSARGPLLENLLGSTTPEPLHDHFLTSTPSTPHNDQVPCGATMFFFLVYGPIYGLVCGVGLIGNSLSFAIMHKYSRDNVATYLLKSLAVVDNAFLATGGFIHIYTAMSIHFGYIDQLEAIHPYLQAYAWPKVHIVQLGTVWMMVLVAANRYIAVCRPLQAAILCSKRNVKRQMIVMFICVVLYNLPRYAEYRYVLDTTESTNETNTTTEPSYHNVGLATQLLYNILYENVAYGLFAYLIPLTTLIILNWHLVRELNRAKRYRQSMASRSSAEEHNITFVMIVIIVAFIICETPACVNQILFYMISDDQRYTCSHYRHFYHISNLLLTTNSALNFFIYCLFRRQFQQELRALVCGISRPGGGSRRTVLLRAMHGGSSEASSTQGSICRGSKGDWIRSKQFSVEYTRGSSIVNGSLHSTVSTQ